MAKNKYTVKEEVTLRQWMKHHFPHIEYDFLQQSIRKGDVKVNGQRLPANKTLQLSDEVEIWDKLTLDTKLKPKKKHMQSIKIIHKDPDFWVVDKPYGVPTQGGTDVAISMVDIMESLMDKKPYVVHRLDKYTTGLMVFATNSYAARDLSESIVEQVWNKVYLTKIGGIPKKKTGRINDDVFGKQALSEYKVLEEYPDNTCLVAIKPITGRMHQVRQHCASALFPIIGDVKYGSTIKDKMYLRCVELWFSFRGKEYEYSCEK